MTVYGLYVFDRHCTCTFYANFSGRNPRPGPSTLPNVYRSALPLPLPTSNPRTSTGTPGPGTERRESLPPWERSVATAEGGGGGDGTTPAGEGETGGTGTGAGGGGREKEDGKGLAFDEEAKLVYGIVFSLRNMVKKLSGREEDTFHSFSTTSYKLHYLLSPTSTHFILVTTPMTESLRFVLRQIYTGPFTEFVVRNAMVEVESREEGKGIDNDRFRSAVEKILVGL